jgi:hypothetical protein
MEKHDRRLSQFAKLWALAALFHQAKPDIWVSGTPETVLTFSSILLILARVTPLRFTLFLGVQTWVIYSRMPRGATDHWIFTLLICLIGLTASVRAGKTTGKWALSAKIWLSEFAGPAKILVLILYFFTTLHKLNYGFLNPAYSCASEHYLDLRQTLPLLPSGEWAKYLAIFSTLAIECSIPVLLFFRGTRIAAVCLALGFHTLIGLNDFFDFSAMLFAILWLFLPYDFSLNPRHIDGRLALPLAAVLTALAGRLSHPDSHYLGIAAGFVYGVSLLGFVILKGRRRKNSASLDSEPIALGSVVHLFPVLLLVGNGFCPYLGLKTESSFAMFSNLRTEGGTNNHLFMPNHQLFSFQKELVQIVEATGTTLREIKGKWVPLKEVQLQYEESLWRGGTFQVKYGTPDGEMGTLVSWGGPLPPWHEQTPYLLRKFLVFRSLDSPGSSSCSH